MNALAIPQVSAAAISTWFEPLRIGDLTLPNRIIFAPATRNQAHTPGPLQAEYYASRALAGLIITEATLIRPQGYEWSNAPGIFTKKQIAGWKLVTDAVHASGARDFQELQDLGRVAHPLLQAGQPNEGPSAIAAKGGKFRQLSHYWWVNTTGETFTIDTTKHQGYVTPEEILNPADVVALFKQAAINSKEAGFDGVELQASGGYLVAQFLDSGSNQRTDEWGGSPLKRCKFALECMKVLVEVWGMERVGIKIQPEGGFNDMGMRTAEQLATYGYLLSELHRLYPCLAYLHVSRFFPDWVPDLSVRWNIAPEDTWRKLYPGMLFLDGDFTPAEGASYIAAGLCDAVTFCRDFVSNPDLVQRIKLDQPLNQIDYSTVYGPGKKGYTEGYPTYEQLSAAEKIRLTEMWKVRLVRREESKIAKQRLYEKQVEREALTKERQ